MPLRRVALVFALMSAFATVVAPQALAAGPILSGLKTPLKVTTLKPGLVQYHYRLVINDDGIRRTQTMYKIVWSYPSSHIALHSGVLGTASNGWIRDNPISDWATWSRPAGLVAAINGDMFDDQYTVGRPDGLLVHSRTVYDFGWGGPGVGYLANGSMVMGRPSAVPALIKVGSHSLTVGAWNGKPLHNDQIGVYSGISTVTVPPGYVGFTLDSAALLNLLHGSKGGYAFRSGSNVTEIVTGFRYSVPGGTHTDAAMAFGQVAQCPETACPSGTVIPTPAGGVVVLAKKGSLAAIALGARLSNNQTIGLAVDDNGWARVTDTMGGKPQLVRNGSPQTLLLPYVDPWQWQYAHWRPAIVQKGNTAKGQGWMVLIGGPNAVGIRGSTFSRLLVQMGATNAMGFDNNSSAELYRPGANPITAYGFERQIPAATYLAFN
jgi:hypothetical protein